MITQPTNTLAVVTAVFGHRDDLKEPRHIAQGVDYICFTDDPGTSSKSWDVRLVDPGDPVYQTKDYKLRTHVHLAEYAYTLWLDASFEIINLGTIFSCLLIDDPERTLFLGLTRHPERKCIYVEAARAHKTRKDHPARLDRVVKQYRAEGHPEDWGLYRGGILLRRNCQENTVFGDAWHQAVMIGSNRDQLSLPVVLRRLNVDFLVLPRGLPHVKLHQHAKRRPKNRRRVRR